MNVACINTDSTTNISSKSCNSGTTTVTYSYSYYFTHSPSEDLVKQLERETNLEFMRMGWTLRDKIPYIKNVIPRKPNVTARNKLRFKNNKKHVL
jgi:hypothetical protein